MDHSTYFDLLTEELKAEKAIDQAQFEASGKQNSVAEKRSQGQVWYPIAIRGQELGRADYLQVELERTTHQEIAHQFRFGAPAVLFSNHDAQQDRIDGIVSHCAGNRIKLTLKTDELPEWSRLGKLGIELQFDNHSYEEMFAALKTAKNTENELINILLGHQKPQVDESVQYQVNLSLNDSQNEALKNIVQAKHLSVIHGPPGTGKTTTVVAAIQELVKVNNAKILVVAPSNAAVDLLADKLSSGGLNVLRVGNASRVSDQNTALTIEEKMALHPSFKEIKRFKKQAAEYKNMAHKYKRNFDRAEREQRKALFDEAYKILKETDKIEAYILEDIQQKTQVVAATLVGSNHYMVRENSYDYVVIDEAGQSLEPACWIAILKAKKVILAGDHCQLPPTLKSDKSKLQETLLEKLTRLHPEAVTLLDTQYRMHADIMAHSSKAFYEGQLKSHPSVAARTLAGFPYALQYIDTAGKAFEEKLEGTSSTNPEEGTFLIERLLELLGNIKEESTSVAIISPYKQQVNLLTEMVKEHPDLEKHRKNIEVNTIDSFQGQERAVVMISLTRSNDRSEIGFLADTRRMNVAMTRAQKLLIVIGDSSTLGSHPFYNDFIAFTQEIDAYKSAWEY